MTNRFTILFSAAQWRLIERHAPIKVSRRKGAVVTKAMVIRALLAKLFAEQGVEFPDDVTSLGGYRGGGRPKKRKDE